MRISKTFPVLSATIAVVLALLALATMPAHAAMITYTVNDNGDLPDSNHGDGACLTSGGKCTLRAAIEQANTLSSGNSFAIHFSIGTAPSTIATITPTTALPNTVFTGTIDGTSSPAKMVELNGTSAGTSNVGGLVSLIPGLTIKGMIVNRFSGTGIVMIGAAGNIDGDYIGVDKTGNNASSNGNDGIIIIGPAVTVQNSVIVGNPNPNAPSSSNAGAAIEIVSGSSSVIKANNIGAFLNDVGAPELRGVYIRNGSKSNTIGGTSASSVNLIGASTIAGVDISDNGTTGNVVEGNTIGKYDAAGHGMANGDGVLIHNGAASNIIGGNTAGQRNVISGNTGSGVTIYDAGSTSNTLLGNYIGTAIDGTSSLPNAQAGVEIDNGAAGNIIGGTEAGDRNVISGNHFAGITIKGEDSDSSVIHGNYIGLNAAGSAALYNGQWGILVYNGADNTQIGGSASGAGNVIAGTTHIGQGAGIRLSGESTTGTLIRGNRIGVDAAGAVALGQSDGVSVDGSPAVIGGSVAGSGNLISGSGNGHAGIEFLGTHDSVVAGNLIGVAANGIDPLSNEGDGILINGAADGISIGTDGGPNEIAFNDGNGISVKGTGASGVNIMGNTIHDNGALGINLGSEGVTPNDPLDADTGANGLQNAPVLSVPATAQSVIQGGALGSVQVDLNSTPNSQFVLSFYQNSGCDLSGFGEGAQFAFSQTVTTDTEGNFTETVGLEAGLTSALATDTVTGNTSEFSNCLAVAPPPTPTPTSSPIPTPTPSTPASPTPTATATPALTVSPSISPSSSVTPTPGGGGMLGDANCDEDVGLSDVKAVLSDVGGIPPGAPCPSLADANCNEHLDADDALRILAFEAGAPLPQPSGCASLGTQTQITAD